jgi:geranyl-CoA carboxylase alpha subunit
MMNKTINSLLVANRGEIAVRVMRTCQSLGIRTIAVYSDADAQAPHVLMADDAVHLGPSPVGESYLVAEKILQAAKDTGADAVHPGYGFLSENSAFAEACEAAGIIFVGPPTRAIEVMGDKAISKRAMIAAGVPCVPGYQGEDQSDATLIRESSDVGFPLMVKAAAGGGGRGMRLVHEATDLPESIALARSEAENAFGNGELIIERAILEPRHVEIQVFADQHGKVIHLGERDCSVQRRHQKVVEESPCPVMTAELRDAMGTAAVEAARAVNYAGAGTVEFLLDKSGEFYFLEMNTRLQVEHPVTELVTGLDLVAMQIAVAQGDALTLEQSDVELRGHAMEVRLYAEDPAADFLPATGPVMHWHVPEREGVRVDTGIASGGEVSPFYDPMVAKIIAYGDNREQARQRLLRALADTALFGTATNRDFLLDVLSQPGFVDGSATTAFIGETWPQGYCQPALADRELVIAAVIQFLLGRAQATNQALDVNPELLNWSSTGDLESTYRYTREEVVEALHVRPLSDSRYRVSVGADVYVVDVLEMEKNRVSLTVEERGLTASFHAENEQVLHLSVGSGKVFKVVNLAAGDASVSERGSDGAVLAPMHGVVLTLEVSEGDTVQAGQTVAVMEAMKMQHTLEAPVDGTVIAVNTADGEQVAADDLLLEIEPDPST